MSRHMEVERLRAERNAARQSADLMAEELRSKASEMQRLAARLEHAEALLKSNGINPGPVCRPLPSSEWLSRQNLSADHPVRKRQGIIL